MRGGWDCSYWPSSCSLSRWSCFPLAVCAALSPLAANETSSSSALLPPSRKDAPLPQARKANETRTGRGRQRSQRQRRKRKAKAKRKCRTEKVNIGIEGLRVFRSGRRMWGFCPLSPPSTTYRVRCRGCRYCWRRYEAAPTM